MQRDILYLSVVIPCYNEEKNIRLGALEKVYQYLKKQSYLWEVLIVDDGSIDGTSKLVQKYISNKKQFKLIKELHQGKARTVVAGVIRAQGNYILFSDLDGATPLSEVEKFLPYLSKGYDVVIGSRNRKREGAPFIRSLMGPGFAFIRSSLIGLSSINDTQCGFKAFKKDVAKILVDKIKLYSGSSEIIGSNVTAGFDVEFLFIAQKLGFKIKEVQVKWHYVETRRVNPIRDSWNGLKDIIKIKILDLQGQYN